MKSEKFFYNYSPFTVTPQRETLIYNMQVFLSGNKMNYLHYTSCKKQACFYYQPLTDPVIIAANQRFRGKKYAPQYRPTLEVKGAFHADNRDPQRRRCRARQGSGIQSESCRRAAVRQWHMARGWCTGPLSALQSQDEIVFPSKARPRGAGEGNPGRVVNEKSTGRGHEYVELNETQGG